MTGAEEGQPELADEARAPFDAYWTPDAHALAVCRWLAERIPAPRTLLEPAVGGGAWVRAVRQVWPDALVHRCDLDPEAPGLLLHLREFQGERAVVGDFRVLFEGHRFDLILGNPPYSGDLRGWIERSQTIGRVVAYVLRETFTGSLGRMAWFEGEGRPSHVVKLLPRPTWRGPGHRKHGDKVDSVLVVWAGRSAFTSFGWLHAPKISGGR